MNVLAIGSAERLALLAQHNWAQHTMVQLPEPEPAALAAADLVIDLELDDQPDRLDVYTALAGKPVMVSAVKHTLHTLLSWLGRTPECQLMGINGLPGFVQRTSWEVSRYDVNQALPTGLPMALEPVADQVGLVAARVLFRIINEAYYMVQEGSAAPDAIDQAMCLGVNYPQGPIAWAQAIGIRHVVEVLEGMRQSLGSDAYAIAPALWQAYQRSQLS